MSALRWVAFLLGWLFVELAFWQVGFGFNFAGRYLFFAKLAFCWVGFGLDWLFVELVGFLLDWL